MKPTQFVRLLIMGWVVLSLSTGDLLADNKNGKRGAKVSVPRQPLETTVVGEDPSKDIAEGVALVNARDKLEEYLKTQTPRINRVPSKDYILSHFLSDRQDREEKGKIRVTFRMKVGEEQYQDMLREELRELKLEREGLARERMSGLVKILAVLVAFLTALAGYLRLEETTKGYYTTWLRIGAISFVGAVGIGMWLAC
jgi:hypothetical protein